jgi:hypothetical protein
MTDSTPSHAVDEAVRLAATSAAALSALSLMLSSANSCGDAFRAAVRHNDLAAATELALVAAGIIKILKDEPRPIPTSASQRNETYRSVSLYGVEADGRPVVT